MCPKIYPTTRLWGMGTLSSHRMGLNQPPECHCPLWICPILCRHSYNLYMSVVWQRLLGNKGIFQGEKRDLLRKTNFKTPGNYIFSNSVCIKCVFSVKKIHNKWKQRTEKVNCCHKGVGFLFTFFHFQIFQFPIKKFNKTDKKHWAFWLLIVHEIKNRSAQ